MLVVLFILGLIFGSFVNVCIYRIPLDKSVISPRSFCPSCKKPIFWYDNLPVLSYILLKGRCRFCHGKIAIQYPIVELLTALLFIVGWMKFRGMSALLFILTGLGAIIISGIDLKHQIIPDSLSVFLIISGLAVSPLSPFLFQTTLLSKLINSAGGMLWGGLFFYFVAIAGKKIFKQEALGGGDIKLMAGWGAWVGWPNVLLCILLASFLGVMVGVPLRLARKIQKFQPIPFGPFLCLGAMLILFFSKWLSTYPWLFIK